MGNFVVKKTESGFSFNLMADNNEVIATSQVYTTKAACLKGIESVADNAPFAPIEDQTVANYDAEENPKFEVYKDKAGEIRFRLKAGNGEIIVVSEGYKAKDGCLKGIDSVKYNTIWSDIVEK
ncbi:MAG: YegP family protein [Clostridia bacterium]|nr:YegP family protein [Clostridia bacterium]